MSRIVELLCSRRVPHVAALALMSIGFAGCSADMSTRLSQNSFSNPFASQPEATGSVPTPAVERRELPQYSRPQSQYQSQALPPPIARAAVLSGRECRRVRRRARAGLLCSARASDRDHRQRRAAFGRGDARAAGQGGTTIIVGTSDTLDTLVAPLQCFARRDPAGQWLQGAARLVAGPATDHSASRPRRRCAAPALAAPASKPVVAVNAAPRSMSSIAAIRLLSIARRNHVSVAELARANSLDTSAKLKLGMKLTVPGREDGGGRSRPAVPLDALPPAPRHWHRTAATAVRRKARGWPRPQQGRRRLPLKRRARQPRRPARCRPSAGRCAAR